MPKFVIEREMPGAGNLSAQELQGAATKSNEVVEGLGNGIQWVESFVTAEKIYCIYNSPSEDLIRQHSEKSGFPANRISRISSVIDPTTAEG
ncbi:MAG: DUF4242 domain-containing protein [bacterium]